MSIRIGPNKPMVATAANGLVDDPMTSWRQHIGRPLDSGATAHRATSDGPTGRTERLR